MSRFIKYATPTTVYMIPAANGTYFVITSIPFIIYVLYFF